jgi:predicted acyl esterase
MGVTQWLAATQAPPSLKAMAPALTASDYHDGWTYQGGAFEQWFNES